MPLKKTTKTKSPPKKRMSTKKETVNWLYKGREIKTIEDCEPNAFAFIYKITLEDGRFYVGKKYMWKPKHTSGKNKGISKGMYPWQSYISSSVELKALIKSSIKYKKEILYFTYSKAETTYRETKEILCNNYLTDKNCLNYWVKATIFSKWLEEGS